MKPSNRILRKWLVTWFGCGESPVAPGTVGSAGAVLAAAVWWIANQSVPGLRESYWGFDLGLAVGVVVVSVLGVAWGPWAVDWLSRHRNTRKPGDPGAFVLDEIAGQWIAVMFMPVGEAWHALGVAVMAFLLFRIFDVAKIWPANRLERLPHGWGIMMDDLAAGLWANVVGQAACRLLLEWK